MTQAITGTRFGEADNNQTVYIDRGRSFTILLKENPSTGYSWNWTLSSGLSLINTSYESGGSLPGSGGTRSWELSSDGAGPQNFTAVYMRSWEPVTGNETVYTLHIIPR